MAWTHDVRPISRRRREQTGPPVLFAGAVAMMAAAWVFASRAYGHDMTLPFVVTLTFGLAAVAAFVAWRQGSMRRDQVTYWDVAGALTFIGMGAAVLIDPEQMVRLVAATPPELEALGSRR